MGLADYRVGTVQELMENFFELVEQGDADGPESWYSVKYGENMPCDVAGLGVLQYVEDYGGEGQGDDYWVVFSLDDGTTKRFFRMDGWYQSHAGGEFDGDLREVSPKAKVITVWE
jgi:hypothetical protein